MHLIITYLFPNISAFKRYGSFYFNCEYKRIVSFSIRSNCFSLVYAFHMLQQKYIFIQIKICLYQTIIYSPTWAWACAFGRYLFFISRTSRLRVASSAPWLGSAGEEAMTTPGAMVLAAAVRIWYAWTSPEAAEIHKQQIYGLTKRHSDALCLACWIQSKPSLDLIYTRRTKLDQHTYTNLSICIYQVIHSIILVCFTFIYIYGHNLQWGFIS